MSAGQVSERTLHDFAVLARDLAKPADLEHTLDLVLVTTGQALLCETVGILLVRDGTITSAAATGADVRQADELQVEAGEGPGLDVVAQGQDSRCDDLRGDDRWPSWGPTAAAMGWRSVLSLGLVGGGRPFGALTLYSRQTGYFSAEDLSIGGVFGAQAALALAGARERDSLLRAVAARHLIGQAQGVLMERYQIDAEQAFTVLRRYSSHLNRKLRLVAEDVVRHRELPVLPGEQKFGTAS